MKNLLIVEDDEVLCALTKSKLEARGYSVQSANTLQEAKTCIQQNEPTLVILDLVLGDVNSLPLIPLILAQNPEAKILMLTGFASIATAVEAVKLGAHNYLPKPATISEIIIALEENEEAGNNQQLTNEVDKTVLTPRRLEWEHIQRVLHQNGGNVSATARELKMHRRTLQRKLQKNAN